MVAATDGQARSAPIRRASARAAASEFGILDEGADCVRDRLRVVEGDERARAGREDVLGVEVRRRHRSAPGGDREGQRPRGDLLGVAVRRDEDVGRVQQARRARWRRGSDRRTRRDPPLRGRPRDARGEADSARHRVAPPPDAFSRRSGTAPRDGARRWPAERRSPSRGPFPGEIRPNVERTNRDRSRSCSRDGASPLAGRRPSTAGAPCWTTRIFSGAQVPICTSRRSAVSVITMTRSASSQSAVRTSRWWSLGLREHGVQRQDERAGELLREGENVLAVGSAEDPVLVLQEDDVDVEAAEEPRRADVVAADRLRDGRDDLWALRARCLVDDRDRADALHAGDAEERRPQVEREGSDPARARRIRREDGGSHGARAPLSIGCPACWRFPACSVPGRYLR